MSDEEQKLNQLHLKSQKSNNPEQDKTTEDQDAQYAGNAILESWETLPAMDKGVRNALFDLHAGKAKAAFDRGVSMAEIHRYFQKLGLTASIATFRKMWAKKFPTSTELT